MPSFGSKVELTSAASSSGLAIADANFIKGAFYTVQTFNELSNIPVALVDDNQLVWVEDASSTYQATVTQPDFINTFTPTVSWASFSGFGSGGGGGSGDVTAVVAGNGLGGGGFSGDLTLNVSTGSGISIISDKVTLDTGSTHFTEAVQAISDLNIFQATGSFQSATANFQITGSLGLNFKNEEKFTINSGSKQVFEIDNYGILTLATQSNTPETREGGVYLDNNRNLYIGV
tara:strand:- start:2712 stop:3407 length:696 start_codon:yes stop_codon:yes gene_type:complete